MRPPASPDQIADLLAASLASVFEALCTQRYGGPISLTRIAPPAPSAIAGFRLERAAVPPVEASVCIRHVGGNVYDVTSTIADGPHASFSYCLPDAVPPRSAGAPRLAHDIATFLLDALERRLGSAVLRGEARNAPGPRRGTSSVRPSPAV
jgi:hypothetical protein